MDRYLVIMVTVLVATQVIRIIQNTINLIRQNKEIERNIKWLSDRDLTEKDFDVQRDMFYMMHEKLIKEGYGDYVRKVH